MACPSLPSRMLQQVKHYCLEMLSNCGRICAEEIQRKPERAKLRNRKVYEDILPADPDTISADRHFYEDFIRERSYPPLETDSPTRALYRMYEHLVLGYDVGFRNEFERFWYTRIPIIDIPEPHDPNLARSACLALVVILLVDFFNERIEGKGMPRNMSSIITQEQAENMEAGDPEITPGWVAKIKPLKTTLCLSYRDDHGYVQAAQSFDDQQACLAAKKLNILVAQPNIHFV